MYYKHEINKGASSPFLGNELDSGLLNFIIEFYFKIKIEKIESSEPLSRNQNDKIPRRVPFVLGPAFRAKFLEIFSHKHDRMTPWDDTKFHTPHIGKPLTRRKSGYLHF